MSSSQSFGRIEVRAQQRELLVDGRPAPVGARAFDVLLTLVERRDRLVTKYELFESVWPGRVVEDHNLTVQVSTLRKLLGPEVIATIPGRGYRFVAAASQLAELAPIAEHSAPSTESTSRTNLPTTPISLIGREADAASLGALLGERGLITLTGAGGVGKSCLAKKLLHERREAYVHGVVWVELAALSDPAMIPGAICRAAGLQTGNGEPLAALMAALRPLNMLIALDNAEHLVDEVARVAHVLREGAPGVQLLVTSQVPLKLPQEQVVWLEPLAVPMQPLPPMQAMEFGAVELFVRRVQALQRRFELDTHNVGAVIELCRQLDGLPLAIELAAARVPLLGVSPLAASLGDRLHLLSAGQRLAPPHQQTLRAALEWSHSLLNSDEQRVLRRLGVFVGGFSMELAQQVAAEPNKGLDDWAVLDMLGALIDRSLVVAEPGEPPRYRLLESTRFFALDRLAAAHEDIPIRTRHARAVCARFERVFDDRLAGRVAGDEGLEALALDADNATEAVNWAIVNDPACAVALMTPLNSVQCIPNAQQARLWLASEPLLTDALSISLRARWALGASRFWVYVKPELAARWGQQAVALQRMLADPGGLYVALNAAAWAFVHMSDIVRASEMIQEARALEAFDLPAPMLSIGASCRGVFALAQRQPEEALCAFQLALSLAIANGDSLRTNRILAFIADVALTTGEIDEAIRRGGELVRRVRNTRDHNTLALALVNLTAAWLVKGNLTEARKTAEEGWPMAPAHGLQPFWADHLAHFAVLESRLRNAAHLLGYADRGYAKYGIPRQPNEASAVAHVERRICEQLGESEFARLRADGAGLRDEDIAAMAFQRRVIESLGSGAFLQG